MVGNGIEFAGVGVVSGYGWGRDMFWSGLLSGKPAARLVGGYGYGYGGTDSVWLASIPEGGNPADGEGLFGRAFIASAYHATGMDPSNDEVIRCAAAETDMMERIFPGEGPHIYALKPLLGHCLASAGSIELAAGLMAYEEKTVPAPRIVSTTHHQRLLDGVCDFEGGVTLKTSMGMGGHNSAVVIGPPAGVGRKTFASESCVSQTGGHRDG
jgi:hypothetical protein